jgi:hypothetical protein
MVARRYSRDLLSYLLDYARAFVAKHNRLAVPVINKADVGMAYAARGNAHQDFIVSRAFQLKGLYL